MAKTATFGVLHLGTSFGVTFALTGNVAIAGAVTFVEPLVNTVMHHFFDKYWEHPRLKAMRQTLSRRRQASESASLQLSA
ncbi:hypothetical protein DBR47_10230 [Paucibacter sp. KBW04]|uniref:DUF2061 domain-containing protein n=1 Tax=Paucibacter sp. KBW04 TaxID=2153361 RepID=UPI000F56CCFD|nr:DUF2061 domain-containing protein [Paucibacter sp. KBW04]RQO59755.1 hypothetical protein DBR47_10230 [Paucibacter sp. KBW04]